MNTRPANSNPKPPRRKASEITELIDCIRQFLSVLQEREQRQIEQEIQQRSAPNLVDQIETMMSSKFEFLELQLQDMRNQMESPRNEAPPVEPAPQSPLFDANNEDEADGEFGNLSTASFLGSWQKQRDEMLSAFSKSEARDNPQSTEKLENEVLEMSTNALSELPGATEEDLNEIQTLKVQLQQAMRDNEVEIAIQRAKISQERAAIEELATSLERREKELNRKKSDSDKKPVRDLFRLQSFLGRRNTES